MSRLIHMLVILSGLVFTVSCTKDDPPPSDTCRKNLTTSIRSINFFDTRVSSPYYNQVVANFKFVQISNEYSGSPSCPQMDCATTLLIQNSTTRKITFDYNLLFSLNLIRWNYQGVAVVPAGGSLDVGQINSNCGSISLGSFLIQSASISYQ